MRFPSQIRTCIYGSRHIDYILMGVAIEQTVAKIEYLAPHEGNMSDHVYTFVDLKYRELFQGVIHRPVDIQSGEFRIEQTDKKVTFQKILREKMEEKNLHRRIIEMACKFATKGANAENVRL